MEQKRLGEEEPAQAPDAPKSRLRLVDQDTGEFTDGPCPGCLKRDENVRAKEIERAGWQARYFNLKRDIEADESHELFPKAKRLFDYWRERCNHPQSDFTAERFKACFPHLRDLGEEICRCAIEGAAYDPFITYRKNGSPNRHDSWALIFQSRDKVEDFANRAPHHLPKPEHVKVLADALAFLHPDWEPHQAVDEAQRRLKAR